MIVRASQLTALQALDFSPSRALPGAPWLWLEVHDNGKSNAHTSFQGFSDSHVTKVLKRQS